MASLRLLRRAEIDFQEGEAFYRSKSVRAAERFERAIDAALERIAENPYLYALYDEESRVCRVERFHRLIAYNYDSARDEVVVTAIVYEGREFPT